MPDAILLTDSELAAARQRRAAGEASLACEGLYLDQTGRSLFDRFETEKLPHDICLQLIIRRHSDVLPSE